MGTTANFKGDMELAWSYLNQGRPKEAADLLTKTLKLMDEKSVSNDKDTKAKIYASRGWAHYLSKSYDAAISDCTNAIELNPSLKTYGTRASARYAKGEIELAITDFKKAITLWEDGTAGFLYNHGFLYFIDKEYKKALDTWNKMLEMEPSWRNAIEPWLQKASDMRTNC